MSADGPDSSGLPTRRQAIAVAGGVAAGLVLGGASSTRADPAEMAREMAKVTGAAAVRPGRVKLDLPELTENGNATPIGIEVQSPMTAADHVRAVHIFSEKNPVTYIARLGIGPRAGRAKVATSIRVADSQTITVLAEMSDGSFWSGQARTEVTTPACIDDSDRPN